MLRRALTIALAVSAIALGSSASAAAVTKFERSVASATAEGDLIALVNSYRASNGLQPVLPNGALTAAAAWMAGDMAARNYIGHVSSDGRSPTQRMSAFGYPATSMYTGEDLGAGYGAANAVLSGWQASAGHNAVLLNPNYDAIGIGLVYEPNSTYKWYWAADFGGPGGSVKIVVPPPAPSVTVPEARTSTTQQAQPVVERAAATSRGSAPQSAENAVDPETAARAARIAFIDERDARRIAHLVAVLQRMGAL
jgi:uncharacterized protein YkwD